MIVSLNRWEWNRALFFGLIVLIAEVGLATGLDPAQARRTSSTAPAADPDTLAAIRSTRPPSPDRFEWLKESTRRAAERLHHLPRRRRRPRLGDGVGRRPARLEDVDARPPSDRLAAKLGLISYPAGRSGGRRRHRPRPGHAGRRRRADPQAPGAPRPGPMSAAPGRLVLGALGLAVGVRRRGRACATPRSPRTSRPLQARRSTSSCPPAPRAPSEGSRCPSWSRRSCSRAVSRSPPTSPVRSVTRVTAGSESRSHPRWTRPIAASSAAASRTGRSTSCWSTSSRSRTAARAPPDRVPSVAPRRTCTSIRR